MIGRDNLKLQKRWVLWKLEKKPGVEKPTKVPYMPDGRHAMSNNPATWSTFADCAAVVSKFSGIGSVLGEVDGVYVCGVDMDGCCDAATGKFTPESREVVIGLDSYGEYSPSGTGAHVLLIARLADDKPIVRPFPGCKQIEIKGAGFYFTFSARHLTKTPGDVMDRQEQLDSLCQRVLAATRDTSNLTLIIPQDEETKFQKLWAGDLSDYANDHSRADFALCLILARRLNGNAFLMDKQFYESDLYREKWDRVDYKWATIYKAIEAVKGEPILDDDDSGDEDGETEYIVDPLAGQRKHSGWFPKGEVSVIGGSSGVGKTSWAMPALESIREGHGLLGHTTAPRDYRVLLHDRSKKSMRRTAESLQLSAESMERVIRLSAGQQMRPPAEILEAAMTEAPGVDLWFIEGLDLWIPKMSDGGIVGTLLDSLQRVAMRHNACILATMGMPKQKGKDRYYGRDSLFGSAVMARKVETVVLLNFHDESGNNSVRRCDILPRLGAAERYFYRWDENGRFVLTDEPAKDDKTALGLMQLNVFAKYRPGDMILYSPELGTQSTFERWRLKALKDGKITRSGGHYWRPPDPGPKKAN